MPFYTPRHRNETRGGSGPGSPHAAAQIRCQQSTTPSWWAHFSTYARSRVGVTARMPAASASWRSESPARRAHSSFESTASSGVTMATGRPRVQIRHDAASQFFPAEGPVAPDDQVNLAGMPGLDHVEGPAKVQRPSGGLGVHMEVRGRQLCDERLDLGRRRIDHDVGIVRGPRSGVTGPATPGRERPASSSRRPSRGSQHLPW